MTNLLNPGPGNRLWPVFTSRHSVHQAGSIKGGDYLNIYKRSKEANATHVWKLVMYLNDKKLNKEKNADTISVIECWEEVKDGKGWATENKNRTVKTS